MHPPRATTDGVDYGEALTAVGRAAGLDVVGIAPAAPLERARQAIETRKAAGLHGGMQFTFRNPARSTDPQATLPGARSLVVGAKSYAVADSPVPPQISAGAGAGPAGRVARYAWIDHYGQMRVGLEAIAGRLRADGFRAVLSVDANTLVDREAAWLAGLGWFGKNANLLLPGRGSWFVLGSVLTDAALPTAPEPVADGCGACRRCLDGCPTEAIVAPGVIDARRCLAWLVQAPGAIPREFRAAMGARIYGCDDCQEVCPENRRHTKAVVAPAGTPVDATVSLCWMLEATDDDLLGRYGRWYIPRREPRYLRRNALVALGNAGDPADARVVTLLARYLASDDELLQAHAVWAAARLGRGDLLEALDPAQVDSRPAVAAELAAVTASTVSEGSSSEQ